MIFFKTSLLILIGYIFVGCGSSSTTEPNSRFYYYSNHTDKSYAGNKMRVKKLSPMQYRIKAYKKAKLNY